MAINHDEIIEQIECHIRKSGGERTEWCVGTAKDARAPFFRRHLAADLGDGLIYREAFTTSAAEQVLDHLVNACGLMINGVYRTCPRPPEKAVTNMLTVPNPPPKATPPPNPCGPQACTPD